MPLDDELQETGTDRLSPDPLSPPIPALSHPPSPRHALPPRYYTKGNFLTYDLPTPQWIMDLPAGVDKHIYALRYYLVGGCVGEEGEVRGGWGE